MTPALAPIAHPPLRYRGGKWRLAPWVLEHMPPHECYVEPYAGGASVLLRKPPARFEVLNDLDGEVVNFWRVLREHGRLLRYAILLTPWSRDEFYRASEPCSDDIESARRFYVRVWQSYAKTVGQGGWRFQIHSNGGWGVDRGRQFHRTAHLRTVQRRLAHVQLDCRPALDVIAAYDRPGTLFYVDPPYVAETRPGSPRLYSLEMTDADHRELAGVLRACTGMVLLSGYPSPLYEELYGDWRSETTTARAEAQKVTTEALWINPAADEALRSAGGQLHLFEEC